MGELSGSGQTVAAMSYAGPAEVVSIFPDDMSGDTIKGSAHLLKMEAIRPYPAALDAGGFILGRITWAIFKEFLATKGKLALVC